MFAKAVLRRGLKPPSSQQQITIRLDDDVLTQLSKAEIARRMSTSRAAVDRLLDSDSESATLATLEKAAAALGRRLYVALV